MVSFVTLPPLFSKNFYKYKFSKKCNKFAKSKNVIYNIVVYGKKICLDMRMSI